MTSYLPARDAGLWALPSVVLNARQQSHDQFSASTGRGPVLAAFGFYFHRARGLNARASHESFTPS